MEPVTNEDYALEPVDDLDPGRVSEIRRIYEDGFAPHLRADFASLTTGREDDESALALMQGSEPRGFVIVGPLGGTGWAGSCGTSPWPGCARPVTRCWCGTSRIRTSPAATRPRCRSETGGSASTSGTGATCCRPGATATRTTTTT